MPIPNLIRREERLWEIPYGLMLIMNLDDLSRASMLEAHLLGLPLKCSCITS